MTVEFAAFEISDYLEDEAVIAEYLLAAGEDPDPKVLARAKSDVVKARAANSVRKARKAMEPLPRVESPKVELYTNIAAIIIAILILTVVAQILLVKFWT
jgi:DNA-binding phage protein